MRIGVLGTGMVGRTIAGRLRELGHEVRVGSRTAGDDAVVFADAAGFGEIVFNCTAGGASLDALAAVGEQNLAGKPLIDVANSLESSGGGLPQLSVCNTDSLGEQIQRAFPGARVVKALNTINCRVMADPARVPGDHVVFVCGDDAGAKAQVTGLLGEFGWPAERVVDLGGIAAARGPEMYVALWVRLSGVLGTLDFNVALAR
jgi:predicted dinucleotide-binding enzyme